MTCSLGFVSGARETATETHASALQAHADKRALIEDARNELRSLRGNRPDTVDRRAELTELLAKLTNAKPGNRPSARPDAQAAGVAFVLSALGWRVSVADVGQWLAVGTVAFLEFAASLSLTVAAALYPVRPLPMLPANSLQPATVATIETEPPRKPGRRPINGKAMTSAERSRRFRAKQVSLLN
jgi:hypothetical protein